jgi:hypothetical protein
VNAAAPIVSETHTTDVRTAIGALGKLLVEVQTQVDAGVDIDLAGLAETTAALCAEVEGLPADEARSMVADLSALVEGCERIAATVAARLAGEVATAR